MISIKEVTRSPLVPLFVLIQWQARVNPHIRPNVPLFVAKENGTLKGNV